MLTLLNNIANKYYLLFLFTAILYSLTTWLNISFFYCRLLMYCYMIVDFKAQKVFENGIFFV